jgi:general L-amino acid transport system substrate-binding protein
VDTVRRTAKNPEIRKFLGSNFEVGTKIGLDNNWTYNVIKQMGNYGEIFDRTLGIPMNVSRGLNKPWNQGGLFYSDPWN